MHNSYTSADAPVTKPSDRWWIAFVLLLVGLAYVKVASFGSVYEDAMWLERAAEPWSWDLLWRPSRFLTMGSYSLQLALGHSLGAIHLTNVALHGLNTVLIWRLALALGWPYPIMVAAIFALHPMQVETVAYITSRGDALAVTGILLAVWLTVVTRVWTVWRIAMVVGVGALTLLAKESAVALMAVLPLATWCGVIPKRRGWYLPTLGLIVLVLAAGAIQLAYTVHASADGNVVQWMALQSVMVFQLTGLAVLHLALAPLALIGMAPTGLTVDFDPEGTRQLVQLAALVGIQYWVFSAARLRHRSPMGAFALLWIVLAVWPRLVIQTPQSTLNQHQFHAAMIGVSFAVAWGWDVCASIVRAWWERQAEYPWWAW